MKNIRIITAIAVAVATAGAVRPALADRAFDDCVQQLCVSTGQMNCWVKAGAELCNDGVGCSDVPDHAGARIIDRMEGQWFLETQYGQGWVEDRYMMVDSSLCPGL
jgi:hypothetical protein